MTVSIFWGEYSKGIPFPLTCKEEKGEVILRISKGGGFINLFFKAPKAMSS